MSVKNVHNITKDFEEELQKYTGAPHAIALDNTGSSNDLASWRRQQPEPVSY